MELAMNTGTKCGKEYYPSNDHQTMCWECLLWEATRNAFNLPEPEYGKLIHVTTTQEVSLRIPDNDISVMELNTDRKKKANTLLESVFPGDFTL
jgi:hypothetical protein